MAYALDMLPQPKAKIPCLECGRCCMYVAVGINTPKTLRYATDVLWYLYHEKVSVLLDGDGEWSVVFETRCRNLQPDLKCATYLTRPEICREYDDAVCEVNDPDAAARTFTAPDEFLEFLKTWRPKVYKQVAAGFLPSPASVAATSGDHSTR